MFNKFNVNRVIGIFLSVVLLASLFGCSKNLLSVADNEFPVTIGEVTIKKMPEKVVALSDSVADIILAMGLKDKLIARTDECTQEDIHSLSSIGSNGQINVDSILELSPDLIIGDKNLSEDDYSKISGKNIPILILKPATSRSSFVDLYKSIGIALEGSSKGEQLGEKAANSILMTLDDINRMVPTKETIPTACYFYDGSKKIATGDTFVSTLIGLSGAINVAESASNFHMDDNSIKLSNPQYIFCDRNAKEALLNDEIVGALGASKNNIFEMDTSSVTRQGRTVIETAIFMAGKMYPEIATAPKSSDSAAAEESKPESTVSSSPAQSSSGFEIIEGMYIPSGETSDNVLALQNRLDSLNYMPTAPNSSFDDYTIRAVKDFQFLNNLSSTGEADEATIRLLFSENAIPNSTPSREK